MVKLRVGQRIHRHHGQAAVFLADGINHVKFAFMLVGVWIAPLLALGVAWEARRPGLAVAQTPHVTERFRAGLAHGDTEGIAVAVELS